MAAAAPTSKPPSWQQTMIRIKDPKKSLPFYRDLMGMTLIHTYKFSDLKFDLYFFASVAPGTDLPEPGTPEAEKFLWTTDLTTLELTHNYGTEDDAEFKYNNGNVEPNRGFGHLAFLTDDVYASCDYLEKAGCSFQKKPDEGNMKGLAFVLDPDGYWIEIIKRAADSGLPGRFNLAQTMQRIKDPKKTLPFYTEVLGMVLLAEKHFPQWKFSLYFLATAGTPKDSDMNKMFAPVLELTHNHGTEDQPDFHYHNGNDQPQGFGHTGFLVDDLAAFEAAIDASGQDVKWRKRAQEGGERFRGKVAFVLDHDGYSIELIQRGVTI